MAAPLYTIRTQFERAAFADCAMKTYQGLRRVNETTVEKTADELEIIL